MVQSLRTKHWRAVWDLLWYLVMAGGGLMPVCLWKQGQLGEERWGFGFAWARYSEGKQCLYSVLVGVYTARLCKLAKCWHSGEDCWRAVVNQRPSMALQISLVGAIFIPAVCTVHLWGQIIKSHRSERNLQINLISSERGFSFACSLSWMNPGHKRIERNFILRLITVCLAMLMKSYLINICHLRGFPLRKNRGSLLSDPIAKLILGYFWIKLHRR